MDIILASKSPRRKKILEEANLKFNIIESGFNEDSINHLDKTPYKYCMKLAQFKDACYLSKINKMCTNRNF